MSSPAKRRKKNDYHGSNKPVRGLDYFFAKQQKEAPNGAVTAAKDTSSEVIEGSKGTDAQILSDEELARKLHEEWNKQEQDGEATESSNDLYEDPPKPTPKGKDVKQATESENTVSGTPNPDSPILVMPKQKNTLSLQSTAAEEDTVSASIPFDQSPLEFEPSKYIPDLQKHWAVEGGHATYALLTRCFVLVNGTTSRIKIVDTLVNLLRTLIESDPDSLLPAVWLATNSISPPYIDLELGLGGSAISKALKKVCGLDNAGLKNLMSPSRRRRGSPLLCENRGR
jgi:DNA ligase-1